MAAGVADRLSEKYKGRLDVKILDTEFMEPMGFTGRGPTHVFLDREKIPVKVAMDIEKMEQWLMEKNV